MASTATLAVAVGSAAAAVTFAVVSVVGSASPRPDLGGPVVVERSPVTTPTPHADDGTPADTNQDAG